MIRKTIHKTLLSRLNERRKFVQVLVGPRQVGKTTLVRQVMEI
jgi:predicted AAA+ superfamily ATPase